MSTRRPTFNKSIERTKCCNDSIVRTIFGAVRYDSICGSRPTRPDGGECIICAYRDSIPASRVTAMVSCGNPRRRTTGGIQGTPRLLPSNPFSIRWTVLRATTGVERVPLIRRAPFAMERGTSWRKSREPQRQQQHLHPHYNSKIPIIIPTPIIIIIIITPRTTTTIKSRAAPVWDRAWWKGRPASASGCRRLTLAKHRSPIATRCPSKFSCPTRVTPGPCAVPAVICKSGCTLNR
mmetsp:Transcript_19640/g.46650  ORF Transcript_19640/g.46650 Transcript_19640/m.46650 type:complete len:236 (+) Transcript_19640:750-1457(+)